MKTLKGTKTEQCLIKAFAGESQARNRYTFYSSVAKKEGYIQISNIFTQTANNEKEHAEIFFNFLAKEYKGEAINLAGDYPVGLGTTPENLKYAASGEKEESDDVYPSFAKIAEEEGFQEIAIAFKSIAKIEKHHEQRYAKLLENIQNDKVFSKDEEIEWVCDNCGHLHKGKNAPKVCPVCTHPMDYFEVSCDNF